MQGPIITIPGPLGRPWVSNSEARSDTLKRDFLLGVFSDSVAACFAEAEMERVDMTDFGCSVIQSFLPTKVRGMKRMDDWRALKGAL